MIYKNEETQRDNQNDKAEPSIFLRHSGTQQNGREQNDGQFTGSWEEKTLPVEKNHLFDIGSIPSVSIDITDIGYDRVAFDIIRANKGIDCITFLECACKMIPDEMFDEKLSVNELVLQVYRKLEEIPGFSIAEIKKDGMKFSRESYSFKHFYVFSMYEFHVRNTENIKRIFYPMLASVFDYTKIHENDLGLGYLESEIDSYEEDESMHDEEHMENMKADYKEAVDALFEYEAASKRISLDILRDREWICDYFALHGKPHWAEHVRKIAVMIENVCPDPSMLVFDPNESYNSDVFTFTFLPEDIHDFWVVDTFQVNFQETGMTVTEVIDVMPYSEPVFRESSVLNPCFVEALLWQLHLMIHDH